MNKILAMLATVTSLLLFISMANAAEITIMRDDFDSPYLQPTDWVVNFSAGANVYVDTANSSLNLVTIPNIGIGTAVVMGTKQFSVSTGDLIFRSRILDSYVDQGIYGDAQPRGLVAGADRNNAIEFINGYPVPNTVICRTVTNGVATSTSVNIGQSVRSPAVYQIIANSEEVRFFINGREVAIHMAHIPNVPLNVYFSTGDSGAGNVPMTIDYVSFERIK